MHTIRGSPYWMSPEHIQGARCGRKADVWSYACVLLEMLTGGMPWLTGGAMQPAAGQFAVFRLMTLIVEAKHPPPMPAPEEIPDGLHELMLACFCRARPRPTPDHSRATRIRLGRRYMIAASEIVVNVIPRVNNVAYDRFIVYKTATTAKASATRMRRQTALSGERILYDPYGTGKKTTGEPGPVTTLYRTGSLCLFTGSETVELR